VHVHNVQLYFWIELVCFCDAFIQDGWVIMIDTQKLNFIECSKIFLFNFYVYKMSNYLHFRRKAQKAYFFNFIFAPLKLWDLCSICIRLRFFLKYLCKLLGKTYKYKNVVRNSEKIKTAINSSYMNMNIRVKWCGFNEIFRNVVILVVVYINIIRTTNNTIHIFKTFWSSIRELKFSH
jgi:hypothetical protein